MDLDSIELAAELAAELGLLDEGGRERLERALELSPGDVEVALEALGLPERLVEALTQVAVAAEASQESRLRGVARHMALHETPVQATTDARNQPLDGVQQVGRFRLLGKLAAGGMGVVYCAHDPTLERIVAVKVLREEAGRSTEAAERFRREARAAAGLSHPNLITIHEIGSWSPGVGQPPVAYIAMELVEGHHLGKNMRDRSLRENVVLLRAAAEGLGHAHAHGVVHRDVKPANILVDLLGRAIVSDFGLARLESGTQMTGSDQRLGTPSYMSPEQVSGRNAEHDARSDVWALGVILYEMIAGQRPFERESPQALFYAILHSDPPAPARGVHRDLWTVCLKALAKEPGRRYQDAAALAAELGRWLAGEPIEARSPGLAERCARAVRRHPWRTVWVLLVMIVGALAWWSADRRWRYRSELELAQRAFDSGEWTRAQVHNDRALSLRPSAALERRAREIAGRLARAERLARHRRALAPLAEQIRASRPFLYAGRIDVRPHYARIARVIRSLETLSRTPEGREDDRVWELIGTGCHFLGRLTAARNALERACALTGSPEPRLALARVLLEQAQTARSRMPPDPAERPRLLARAKRVLAGCEAQDDLAAWQLRAMQLVAAGAARARLLEVCREGRRRFAGRMGSELFLIQESSALTGQARLDALAAALRIRPHYPWLSLAYGTTLFLAQRFVEATEALTAALTGNPRLTAALINRAQVWLKRGQPEKAAADASAALALEPGAAQAYLTRAEANVELRRFDRVEPDLAAAERADPYWKPVCELARVRLLHRQGKGGEARARLASLRGEGPRLGSRVSVTEAELLVGAGDLQGGLALLDRVLRRAPDDYDALLQRGLLYVKLGRFGEALADLDRFVRANPRHPFGHCYRGEALRRMGRYAQAIKDLDEAIRVVPSNARLYLERALARNGQGDRAGAMRDLDRAIAQRPRSSRLRVLKARWLRLVGKNEEALKSLELAAALSPESPEPQIWRARLLGLLGKHQAALRAIEAVLRLAPKSGEAYGARGELRQKLGDHRLAIEDFGRAIALTPRWTLHVYRARSYAALGQKAKARADYRVALRGAPAAARKTLQAELARLE